MNKSIYFFSILVVLSFTVSGQSKRLVLFEEFTQASCGPCASQNPAFDKLLVSNAEKCISVKYHTSWPGSDVMYNHNKTESAARVTFYGVSGVPYAVLDKTPVAGSNYLGAPANTTQAMIDAAYGVSSPFELFINQKLSSGNDTLFVTVLGRASAPVLADMVLQCVVIEKHIQFSSAPGTNGEKDFYNVMKKMLPTSSGTKLQPSFQTGDFFLYTFSWKLANVYDVNELSVVGFIQNSVNKTIYQAAQTTATPITGLNKNDISLMNPGNIMVSICNPRIEPTFELQNEGFQPLVSADIKYRVNNEPEFNYHWTGNLSFLQKAKITLPAITYTVKPSNVLKIQSITTNGTNDDNPKNDSISYNFVSAPNAGLQITVAIKTDNKPEETTWKIKDLKGNILASGGPYAEAKKLYNEIIDLAPGTCYEFSIVDAGNDGMCCTNGAGFFKVYNDNITISSGNSFTNTVVNQFYSASAVGLGTVADAAGFSVSPNPAYQKATIAFVNARQEQVAVQVYTLQGAVVLSLQTKLMASGQHEIEIDCSTLRTGVYNIRLIAGNKLFSKKITVKK